VRLVDENGEFVGILERDKAIFFAKDRGFDLAIVAENANPPVAKLIDFGKYQYEQEKIARKQRKGKTGELKEIRIGFKISEHDLDIKIKRAEKFIVKGHRVRVNLRLRGREMQFQPRAYEMLAKFAEKLAKISTIESPASKERNQFNILLKPAKSQN